MPVSRPLEARTVPLGRSFLSSNEPDLVPMHQAGPASSGKDIRNPAGRWLPGAAAVGPDQARDFRRIGSRIALASLFLSAGSSLS